MILWLLIPFFIAYFIGSIPFGLILGKLFGVGDIRHIGSGNIGATNMLRTGKKGLALATLLLDFLKGIIGYIAGYVANEIIFFKVFFNDADITIYNNSLSYILRLLIIIAPVLGHIFPVWLKFKGGKGVATSLGILCAIQLYPYIQLPLIGLTTILLWIGVFYFTRISSLAAIISIGASPLIAVMFIYDIPEYNAKANPTFTASFSLLLALLVIAKHKDNIKRLLNGTESKWRKINEPS